MFNFITAQAEAGTALPWANLTATAALIGLLVFFTTRFLPSLLESQRTELATERQAFSESLKTQRDDFREELQLAREQSKFLAESGHVAVSTLSAEVAELAVQLKEAGP